MVPRGLRGRVQALLESLAEIWTVNDAGGLTSSDFDVHFLEPCLIQLLDFAGSGLSQHEFQLLARQAIHEVIKAGTPTADEFSAAFDRRSLEIREGRRRKYYFQSKCHFSTKSGFWLPIDVLGSKGVLSHDPPGFPSSKEFFCSGYGAVDPHKPTNGTYLLGQVSSRSEAAALDEFIEHFAVVLGTVNLWLGLGRLSWGGGQPDVMALAPHGQEVILFDQNGRQNLENISFFSTLPKRVGGLRQGHYNRLENIGRLTGLLNKRKKVDKPYYRQILKLYFDAITETDTDYQLIRLWRLAEAVTFSGASSPERVAERLAMTWDDTTVVEAVCFAAGHRRNSVVHGLQDGLRLQEVVEKLRSIVEFSIWASLGPEVVSISQWKRVLELASANEGLDLLSTALPLATKLKSRHRRRPAA